MSLDGGANWRRSENPPGLPDYGSYGVYVQRVYASKIDENVVYALFENTKNGDFKPYIYKSTNRGGSMDVDLPAICRPMARRSRLPRITSTPICSSVGTEFGLFFTVDGGKKWIRLRNNLPTIPVRDLAIQERENDLVLATFGRGFYVLDDYSPLRQRDCRSVPEGRPHLSAKTAVIEVPETGKARGSQGEQHWMAENPPDGAVITYWMRETPRTLRQRRQDAARAAEQKKAAPPYPSQTRSHGRGRRGSAADLPHHHRCGGKVVRRLDVPGGARDPPLRVESARRAGHACRRGGGGGVAVEVAGLAAASARQLRAAGHLPRLAVTPGRRRAHVAWRRADYHRRPPIPASRSRPRADGGARRIKRTCRSCSVRFTGALEQANNMKTRTTAIRRAIADSAADLKLLDEAVRFDQRVTAVQRALRGDETLRGLESGSPSSIQSRVNSAAAGARGLTGTPTGTQQTELHDRVRGAERRDWRSCERSKPSCGSSSSNWRPPASRTPPAAGRDNRRDLGLGTWDLSMGGRGHR